MSTASVIHELLHAEGVPCLSVREKPAGVFAAVLDSTATDAQRARAAEACASPPTPSIEERARAFGADPALVTACAILLRSRPAPKEAREWAQKKVDSLAPPE